MILLFYRRKSPINILLSIVQKTVSFLDSNKRFRHHTAFGTRQCIHTDTCSVRLGAKRQALYQKALPFDVHNNVVDNVNTCDTGHF